MSAAADFFALLRNTSQVTEGASLEPFRWDAKNARQSIVTATERVQCAEGKETSERAERRPVRFSVTRERPAYRRASMWANNPPTNRANPSIPDDEAHRQHDQRHAQCEPHDHQHEANDDRGDVSKGAADQTGDVTSGG